MLKEKGQPFGLAFFRSVQGQNVSCVRRLIDEFRRAKLCYFALRASDFVSVSIGHIFVMEAQSAPALRFFGISLELSVQSNVATPGVLFWQGGPVRILHIRDFCPPAIHGPRPLFANIFFGSYDILLSGILSRESPDCSGIGKKQGQPNWLPLSEGRCQNMAARSKSLPYTDSSIEVSLALGMVANCAFC